MSHAHAEAARNTRTAVGSEGLCLGKQGLFHEKKVPSERYIRALVLLNESQPQVDRLKSPVGSLQPQEIVH